MLRDEPFRDPVVPAAAHLASTGAHDLLAATVAAAGGELVSARASHLQYRPGADVVVRYETMVAWNGAAPVRETLIAGSTGGRVYPGTVPMVAHTENGILEVGVWRWPFDPVLPGLADAVTPQRVERMLGGVVRGPVVLEVVAYRPTERAVVRVVGDGGRQMYLKVVAPRSVEGLVARHHLLRSAGVPVPGVVAANPAGGWFAMEALPGDTLRTRVKAGLSPWPGADEFHRLTELLCGATLPGASAVMSRITAARSHAAMLAAVLPDQVARLGWLDEAFAAAADASTARAGRTIHGDLYEAQLIVDGSGRRITGVLDIDDAGPGDPLDDHATVLAHLRYRAAIAADAQRAALTGYADALRSSFARHVDAAELDIATAAALVGLATGPFRVQQRGWRSEVRRQLGRAIRLSRPHEKELSVTS